MHILVFGNSHVNCLKMAKYSTILGTTTAVSFLSLPQRKNNRFYCNDEKIGISSPSTLPQDIRERLVKKSEFHVKDIDAIVVTLGYNRYWFADYFGMAHSPLMPTRRSQFCIRDYSEKTLSEIINNINDNFTADKLMGQIFDQFNNRVYFIGAPQPGECKKESINIKKSLKTEELSAIMRAYNSIESIIEKQNTSQRAKIILPPNDCLSECKLFTRQAYTLEDNTHTNLIYGELLWKKIYALMTSHQ